MMLRWRTYGGPQIPFAVQKASAALWREETHPLETREWYRKNFRVAEQILHNRFGYYTPGGGFFLWLDVGDGEEATRKLWREAHVKVLPGAYACRETDGVNTAERYIRVALVHDEKTTREATDPPRRGAVGSACAMAIWASPRAAAQDDDPAGRRARLPAPPHDGAGGRRRSPRSASCC